MIKRYYRASSGDQISTVKNYRQDLWVHAESPNETEIAELTEQFGLVTGHIEDALDEDEMPRLEIEGKQLYAFVRIALRDKDGEYDTFPLLIILVDKTIITIAARHFPALETLTSGQASFVTSDRIRLVLLAMQQVTEQYDRLIDRTSRKIKAVRQRLRTHAVTNQDFVDFVIIEDELNEFLSALQPNNAVLRRLLVGRRLDDDDQELVEDVLLMNEQSIENCNSNIKSIVGVRDAHSSISDNSLNQTMKVLTVATLAMAIPNMIFGVYSMNVETPFQHANGAFEIIVGFTVVVLVIAMWLGHKKGIF